MSGRERGGVASISPCQKIGSLPSLFDVASHRSRNMARALFFGKVRLLWAVVWKQDNQASLHYRSSCVARYLASRFNHNHDNYCLREAVSIPSSFLLPSVPTLLKGSLD